jgi:hypothetical protein
LVGTGCGAYSAPSIDCGGMLPPHPTSKLAMAPRVKRFVLVVFVFVLAIFLGARFSDSLQGTDFPDFYCAARMLAEGHGHQLYDADVQRQYQARYTGRVGTLYIHPPFEAVLYLAVAWLPLERAYLVWSLLSLAFLAAGLRLLTKDALQSWDWSVLLAASLTFVPVLLCLLQGQDSLLLLLLIALGFRDLRRGKPFAAGCWLGLGLFKFQIVLPLVLVLLLTQSRSARSEVAKGFSLVALTLAGLSATISGWSVFTAYPEFLLHLQAQPFAGIIPQAMANFRGLTYFFFGSGQTSWAVAAVAILCTAALIRTLTGWNHAHAASHPSSADASREEFDLAFANTVLFALLVSYHLNPHDLTLLLLPIAVLLHRMLARTPVSPVGKWIIAGLLAILFLPPLHLWTLRTGDYGLVGLPVLGMFLTSASLLRHRHVRE